MKNKEIIEELQKEGLTISHATFYRLKRKNLIKDGDGLKEVRKLLKKIELRKRKSLIDNMKL